MMHPRLRNFLSSLLVAVITLAILFLIRLLRNL